MNARTVFIKRTKFHVWRRSFRPDGLLRHYHRARAFPTRLIRRGIVPDFGGFAIRFVLLKALSERGLNFIEPVPADLLCAHRRLDHRHQLVDVWLRLARKPIGRVSFNAF